MNLSAVSTDILINEVIKRLTGSPVFSGNLQLNFFKGGITNIVKSETFKLEMLVL